jgi:hypothetical protein
MITLLASIAGFITSIIPELIKFLRDRHEKIHELEIMDRQMKYSGGLANKDLEEIYVARDLVERTALYATYNTGVYWIDALNGSVRPMLAYSFFILYSFVKTIQYRAISSSAHAIEHMNVLWNVDDQAIFAGIISFYFGQRTFNKAFGRR